MRFVKTILIACAMVALTSSSALSEGKVEYKQFRLEKASCDAAIAYMVVEGQLNIGVSAVAYGKGAEFRKWEVKEIRIVIDGERIKPDTIGAFFVRKGSLFRFPAAVVFAALAAQVDAAGSDMHKGITRTGSGIGFGLLVMQAKGDIGGERYTFHLNRDIVDKIVEGRDVVEITIENTVLHLKEGLKIAIQKAPAEGARFDYNNMEQDELMQIIETLDGQVDTLKKNLGNYKYGADPEYDKIQKKIEDLEVERGLAHIVCLSRSG